MAVARPIFENRSNKPVRGWSTVRTIHGRTNCVLLTHELVDGIPDGGSDHFARQLVPVRLQAVQQRALARVVQPDEQQTGLAPPRRPSHRAQQPRQFTPNVHHASSGRHRFSGPCWCNRPVVAPVSPRTDSRE